MLIKTNKNLSWDNFCIEVREEENIYMKIPSLSLVHN